MCWLSHPLGHLLPGNRQGSWTGTCDPGDWSSHRRGCQSWLPILLLDSRPCTVPWEAFPRNIPGSPSGNKLCKLESDPQSTFGKQRGNYQTHEWSHFDISRSCPGSYRHFCFLTNGPPVHLGLLCLGEFLLAPRSQNWPKCCLPAIRIGPGETGAAKTSRVFSERGWERHVWDECNKQNVSKCDTTRKFREQVVIAKWKVHNGKHIEWSKALNMKLMPRLPLSMGSWQNFVLEHWRRAKAPATWRGLERQDPLSRSSGMYLHRFSNAKNDQANLEI